MANYLVLTQWTEKGITNVKGSPGRLDDAKKVLKRLGVEIKSFHLLMGEYDHAILVEAPSDEALAKALLLLGSNGNIRTHSMRAFTEDEYRKVIGSLP